jgi:hypothetical protein
MVMSAHMREQLRISGKGNYVASRGAAQRPVPVRKGGKIPESASTRMNRRTSAARQQGKR